MIPLLLNDYANKLLTIEYPTNAIFLYANDFIYHEEYFKLLICKMFNITKVPELVELEEYKHNSYYFQFDMSIGAAESILKINTIIKNKHVCDKKFVFFITNFTYTGVFNRIIDRNQHVLFVFSSKTANEHHQGLISRCLMLNMSFKVNKVYDYMCANKDLKLSFDEFKTEFQHSHYSIPVFISKLETGSLQNKAKYEQAICDLLDSYKKQDVKSKTKAKAAPKIDQLELIKDTRDICYKLYHLCISLSHICKICIIHLENHKKIHDIVQICAKSEHKSTLSHKNILCYEQMFLNIAAII